MPPKKDEQAPKKLILGRPGNTLKLGIVGLPNVGKSTTFNLLSKLHVPAENFPFCTIEPNIAKVSVPDPRFDKLCQMWKPKSQVPAVLHIVDIAGLVPGAHEGAGLGNAFLSHIQGVDGLLQVVRAFEDEDITHTEGDVNPVRDLDIISTELTKKDLAACEKKLDEVEAKIKRTNDKNSKEEKEVLDKCKELLTAGKWIRSHEWKAKDVDYLNSYLFLTAKPSVYLVNLSIADYKRKGNKWLAKIAEWVTANGGGPVIPYSADYEGQLMDAAEGGEKKEETKADDTKPEEGVKKETPTAAPSVLGKIIKTGYKALDLIYYFTAGEDEVRCWTIRDGTKAPGAAGVIHTDFEKGFICADVMRYEDFVEAGSETAVKANGKLRQQGKEYVVLDGDICHFKFNVSGGGKK